MDNTFGRKTCRMERMKSTNKELKPKKKIKIGKEKLVVDVTTRLHHGCRLISDWLYIPIRFQHSEEDHTHNAEQKREGKLRL